MDGFVAAYRRLGPDGHDRDGLLRRPRHAVLLERGRPVRAVRPVLLRRQPSAAGRATSTGWPGRAARARRRCTSSAGYDELPTIFDRLAGTRASPRSSTSRTYDPAHQRHERGEPDPVQPAGQGAAAQHDAGSWTAARWPARRRPQPVLPRPAQRHAAGRLLHRHRRGPARTRRPASHGRAGVRPQADQRADAEPLLVDVGVHVDLRRLGWVVRPRAAAEVDARGYGFRVPALLVSPYAARASSTTPCWTTPRC